MKRFCERCEKEVETFELSFTIRPQGGATSTTSAFKPVCKECYRCINEEEVL